MGVMLDKTLILCDCSGSQDIDTPALSKATGAPVSQLHSTLCTTQVDLTAAAISGGDAIICCAQEHRLFEALAEELEAHAPQVLDLRDRAGWSDDPASKLPKMAALVAEAALPATAEKVVDVRSEGLCLIIGAEPVAIPAAEALKDHLGVTVLLTDGADLPVTRSYDVIRGTLKRAQGALGQFSVEIDALEQLDPTGRGAPRLTPPRDGGRSECDILLDLTGDTPLFPAPEKREGYLRADPSHAPSIAEAVMQASHLVGTFEKPLYIKAEPLLCAHSRASQSGCSRCLDVCPTGAIQPDGDHVVIDPMICAGCGACSSLCPSGAISYDAPPVDLTIRRTQTLARAYLEAGGKAPRLLVVNDHGSEMIRLSARFGRGLPADVIPLELSALAAFGHAEMLAAAAAGFADVTLVMGPGVDADVIAYEAELARAMGAQITLLDTSDPDAMSDALYDADTSAPITSPVRPVGSRRQVARQAAIALNPDAEVLPLPDKAPYGATLIDTDACTLCLSCVSLCPSGALGDNPDLPQLRFQEDACLQCGICASTCPEKAITLAPQMNLTASALDQQVLHEEEPFACIECGALFGVKSTIEKITEKLAGNHAMFANPEAARMIQMCDNCRVNAQYHSQNNPFEAGDRPVPRTTADYLSKRRDH
ncbi:4Fe-4S binding protein [Aliiroseovarius sp. F20344]|uniref:4Fe-4S binding protein n=1 Tax=Aliiroseovarius sp. F20344 TaxID=2926414 RepID=UPI001FF2571E|nr:4Fe-4S binding protein [Aliiroseovarius sp. F20344]MCK0142961.1 4Fe-4S binding protein [Aliiroseovarius sp. F20344]